MVAGDEAGEWKCVQCSKRIYREDERMGRCAEPGCSSQTKGAYCFEHARTHGAKSAKDSTVVESDAAEGILCNGKCGRAARDGYKSCQICADRAKQYARDAYDKKRKKSESTVIAGPIPFKDSAARKPKSDVCAAIRAKLDELEELLTVTTKQRDVLAEALELLQQP